VKDKKCVLTQQNKFLALKIDRPLNVTFLFSYLQREKWAQIIHKY